MENKKISEETLIFEKLLKDSAHLAKFTSDLLSDSFSDLTHEKVYYCEDCDLEIEEYYMTDKYCPNCGQDVTF